MGLELYMAYPLVYPYTQTWDLVEVQFVGPPPPRSPPPRDPGAPPEESVTELVRRGGSRSITRSDGRYDLEPTFRKKLRLELYPNTPCMTYDDIFAYIGVEHQGSM